MLLPVVIMELVALKLSYTCLISPIPGAAKKTTKGINSDEFLKSFKDCGLVSKMDVLPSSMIALMESNFVPYKWLLKAPYSRNSCCLIPYSMSSRSTNQYRIPLSSSGLFVLDVWGSGAANWKIKKKGY